jgi:hypothetical protein
MSPLPFTLLLKPCAKTDVQLYLVVAFALKSTELLNFRRKPRGEHGVNVNLLHPNTLAS